MRRARFVIIALVASAAGASCFGPTQLRLAMSTDLACEGLTTAVYVGPAGARPDAPRAETSGCAHASGADNLGTIVLSPSGARDERVLVEVITATGGKRPEDCRAAPAGCVVARRLVSYRRGETRALPVRIASGCVGVRCDDLDETCVRGVCLPANVDDARFCDGISCAPDAAAPLPDAGADADAVDAAVDAPVVDPNAPCAAGERVLATGVRVLGTAPMRVGTTHIYWFAGTGAFAAPKSGGAPITLPTGTTIMSPTPLALFSTDGAVVRQTSFDGLVTGWTASVPNTGLAGADDRAYVLSSNAIVRYGPNAQIELSFAANDARFVATTAEDVVWVTSNQIVMRRIVGAQTRFFPLAAGFQTPADLVATRSGWIAVSGVGPILELLSPAIGGAHLQTSVRVDPGESVLGIALDDTSAYATTTTGSAWTVSRFSLATGARTVVTSGPEILSPPASDGTCLYFARGNPQSADLVARPRQ